jgi:hypothetical protein
MRYFSLEYNEIKKNSQKINMVWGKENQYGRGKIYNITQPSSTHFGEKNVIEMSTNL